MQWIDYLGDDPIQPVGRATRLYMGPDPSPAISPPDVVYQHTPQVFLPQIHGDRKGLDVHFHRVAQFQYLAFGSARFGHHQLAEGGLQYADALVPYGPIRPGASGCAFLTIREEVDLGAFNMPDSQADLLALRERVGTPTPRRNLLFDLPTELAQQVGRGWRYLVDDPDGLRVAVAVVGAGRTIDVPSGSGESGYLVLVDGDVDGERQLKPRSIGRYGPDDGNVRVVAGPNGAHLALLELPLSHALTSLDG